MNLFIIAETMDPVSTKCRPPDESIKGVGSAFAEQIVPTHTFETAPPLDVLIVPGGQGTRLVPDILPMVDFIRRSCSAKPAAVIDPESASASASSAPHQLQYLITICTGSGLAARAGVLDGLRATTNKLAFDETAKLGPKVKWVRRARWVRADGGRVWTASGISAGIDVTFAWIAEVYGEEVAAGMARRMEYRRVTDSEDDPFSDLS